MKNKELYSNYFDYYFSWIEYRLYNTISMIKVYSKKRFSSIEDFEFVKNRQLGCGSFGTVKLARHKNTCRLHAIKVVWLSIFRFP